MVRWNDYILENKTLKTEEKIKIIILTQETVSPIYNILLENNDNPNVNIYSLNLSNIKSIEDVPAKSYHIIKTSDVKLGEIKISPSNTVFIFRRGVLENTTSQMIATRLEELNFFCVNPLQAMITCENKYLTHLRFDNSNVKSPRTALLSNLKNFPNALKMIGGKYPFVMKILQGTHGVGVSIVESENSFRSVYQTFQALVKKTNIEVLLQEMIPADFDLRVHVVRNNSKVLKDPLEKNVYDIIGYMRREKIKNEKGEVVDFRTNFSKGGEVKQVEDDIITEDVRKLAIDAAKAVEGYWCGVDVIINKETKEPYVLEVNTSSGIKGITKVNPDFPKVLLKWITNKNNWVSNTKSIGYLEKLVVSGMGEFVAKFDTGNGALCSTIIAENIEIKEDKVYWEINGKKFVKTFIKYIEPSVGTEVHKRPVVKLDVEFLGKKYKGVEFALTDTRIGKSTPILINRKFMRILGINVDASTTFKLEDFIDSRTGEPYNAKKSIGKKYSGINLF